MSVWNLFYNTKGMTLVESITAIALIAVFTLILYSGFLTTTAVMQRGDEKKRNEEAAANLIEGETELRVTFVSPESKSLVLELCPGKKIQIKGSYLTIQNDQTKEELFTLFKTE